MKYHWRLIPLDTDQSVLEGQVKASSKDGALKILHEDKGFTLSICTWLKITK